MAALEIEGKIKTKLTPRSGSSARGGWTSQDFVVEYQDGNYPADACITAFGDEKVRDLDRFQVGDAVKVSGQLPPPALLPLRLPATLPPPVPHPWRRRRHSTTCLPPVPKTTCRSKLQNANFTDLCPFRDGGLFV